MRLKNKREKWKEIQDEGKKGAGEINAQWTQVHECVRAFAFLKQDCVLATISGVKGSETGEGRGFIKQQQQEVSKIDSYIDKAGCWNYSLLKVKWMQGEANTQTAKRPMVLTTEVIKSLTKRLKREGQRERNVRRWDIFIWWRRRGTKRGGFGAYRCH